MSYSEEHFGLAAEYVLGTLDNLERVQVETMMTVDAGFRDLVQGWEGKLGELHGMVGPVEPPAHVWTHIKAVINGMEPPPRPDVPEPETRAIENVTVDAPPTAPAETPPEVPAEEAAEAPASETVTETPPPPPPADEVVVPAPTTRPAPRAEKARPAAGGEAVALLRRARRWRSFAGLMTVTAAGLGAYLAVETRRPDLLPQQLRRPPKIETVRVEIPAPPAPPTAASGQFVALLQKDTLYPGFIVSFDQPTKTLTVRRLMAPPEAGKSYELWLVSSKTPAPRSLGLIGQTDFTAQPAIAEFDVETVQAAVYLVTVEAAGGSTTGAPSSAPVFAGRLIEVVPASSGATK